METLASRLEETRLSLAGTVKSESKRWQHYLGQRAQQVRTELVSTLSLTALERTVLARVDASLVALDGRVRARLETLAKKKAPKRARPRSSKATARATKTHATALAA